MSEDPIDEPATAMTADRVKTRSPRTVTGAGALDVHHVNQERTFATPSARNRLPVIFSAVPLRSRYGVTPPRWNG
ncbi:hypothetical protein SAMN05421541_113102 [Actinoplanes philippinensis]|uniref:Uncharacterized protein n=1 Tax=Actinoplanes philippinensis TaxID=35752 RepID=A0A1I2JN10_9ACTN|nr:hypothetical protein SAMN05421541_113102 [Actinoplanes philippinensis]